MIVLVTSCDNTKQGRVTKPIDLIELKQYHDHDNQPQPLHSIIAELIARMIQRYYPSQHVSVRDISLNKMFDMECMVETLSETHEVYDGKISILPKITPTTKLALQQQCCGAVQFESPLKPVDDDSLIDHRITQLSAEIEYLVEQRTQLWSAIYQLRQQNELLMQDHNELQRLKNQMRQIMSTLNNFS